jgi:multiple sugar transport system permease protein
MIDAAQTLSEPLLGRSRSARASRELGIGLLFLAPNILGFLAFTLVPLVYSLVLAFSNWDLRLHNMFKPENHIQFVALANFRRLLWNPDFWRFFGNTLYLMLGMPVGIALALMSAILLSKDMRGGNTRNWIGLIATSIFAASIAIYAAYGTGNRGMTLLLLAVAAAILIGGTIGGTSVYRTLFYIPNFTSGVATMLLWKKLFQPTGGVINNLLTPPLAHVTKFVVARHPWEIAIGMWVLLLAALVMFAWGASRLRRFWSDGDVGTHALLVGLFFLLIPVVCAQAWLPAAPWSTSLMAGGAFLVIGWQLARSGSSRDIQKPAKLEGIGSALVLSVTAMAIEMVLIGFALVFWNLPAGAAGPDGLAPPAWLQSGTWVKPAMMLMGVWGAVGSGTMLLYLAALTNVPQELYEAAEIDGAGRFAKFWNVTWPQLAPTTFFIVVMGMIGGLQGGFDQAKVLTQGGPAGASTTLTYMIYQEGFETGRLGYSSAAAWTLFLLVLIVTAFNWQFGNKYVND